VLGVEDADTVCARALHHINHHVLGFLLDHYSLLG
jgi:hypothetical protein